MNDDSTGKIEVGTIAKINHISGVPATVAILSIEGTNAEVFVDHKGDHEKVVAEKAYKVPIGNLVFYSSPTKATVIKDYAKDDGDEIALNEGQSVFLLSHEDRATWWQGFIEGGSGEVGLFPKNNVRVAGSMEYVVDASHDLPMMSIKGNTVYVHGNNNSIGIVRTRTHQGVPTIISITDNQSTTYIVTLEQDKSKSNTLTVLGTKEMESDTGGQTTESQPEPEIQPEPQPDSRLSQLRRTHLSPPVAHALSVDSVDLGECRTNYFTRELVLSVTLSYYNGNPALTFKHRGHEKIQSVVVIPLINQTADCRWAVHISRGNHIKFTSERCAPGQREYKITTELEHKQKARAGTRMKSAVEEKPGTDTYDKLIAWLNAYTGRSDADTQIQSEAGFLFEETSFLPESTSAPSLVLSSEGALEPEPTLEPEGPSNQVISSGSQPESVRIPVERTPEKTGFLSRIFQGSGDAVADEPISDVQSEDSDIQLIIKTNKHNGNDAATLAIFKDNPNLRTQFDEMLAAAKQEAGSTSGGGKKSTRRKSTRRKSTRRKSTRRKSTRRKSTRRKSTRRKSRTRRR